MALPSAVLFQNEMETNSSSHSIIHSPKAIAAIGGTRWWVAIVLMMLTAAVYFRAGSLDFTNYDDPNYVLNNPQVQQGLTGPAIYWAFTANHAGNWHPLTWLSLAIDWKLFGDKPGGYHFINVLFHVVNTMLLFLVLQKMTRRLWPSAFVAALFALHPLHVESVAWISERKDVLSAFFWLLTMWAYVYYVESKTTGVKQRAVVFYVLSLLCCACGLLSKAMVVTLPCVLFLMDFWPLRRLDVKEVPGGGIRGSESVSRLIWEKVPFFALVVGACFMTFWAQKAGGAVETLGTLPMESRLANALVAYAGYVGKMFWPTQLSPLYPHPGQWPGIILLSSVLLLAVVTSVVVYARRSYPYLLIGWLWFLGTMVPTIGIVQVGIQSMADRYTYLPLIGLFIVVTWTVADLCAGWRWRKPVLISGATAILVACALMTSSQIPHWKNGETLFRRAIDVAMANPVYRQAMTKPIYADLYINLGIAQAMQGKLTEATLNLKEALRLNPNYADVHANLGNLCAMQEKWDEAQHEFKEAARLNPHDPRIQSSLAAVLGEQKRFTDAVDHYLAALKIQPDFIDARFQLGITLERIGRRDEAIQHYKEILKANPEFGPATQRLMSLE